MAKNSIPAQVSKPLTSMRTRAADGIKKPKIDPLNAEASPLTIQPKESTTKHNNHSEAAKVSWATCWANSGATRIQNSASSGSTKKGTKSVTLKQFLWQMKIPLK